MNGEIAKKLFAQLRTKQDEMVAILSEAVRLESPSAVPASQAAVLDLFAAQFSDLDFRCRRLSGQKTGGQLMAVPREYAKHSPRQLLLGHCDTVWPQGTLEKMPVENRDGRLHGPGIYDMKGGLVQAIFALGACAGSVCSRRSYRSSLSTPMKRLEASSRPSGFAIWPASWIALL